MSNHQGQSLPNPLVVLSLIGLSGCIAFAQPKPEAPPATAYQPDFSFRAAHVDKKLGVTVGVISPQFTAGASLYQQAYRDDEVVKAMLSGMSATFNEVLIAKGFNTKGPFVSLNDMTFPEKKGSDLLLYPEFDFQVQVKIDNTRSAAVEEDTGGGATGLAGLLKVVSKKPASNQAAPARPSVCDAVLTVTGNMLFVAQEPLSGERMWIKRLDISKGKQRFSGQRGLVCSGDGADWTPEIKNAWAKAHEIIYQESMKSFDNYINGEEFQMLKHQSQEVRAKKTY